MLKLIFVPDLNHEANRHTVIIGNLSTPRREISLIQVESWSAGGGVIIYFSLLTEVTSFTASILLFLAN